MKFFQTFVESYQIKVANAGPRSKNAINNVMLIFRKQLKSLTQISLVLIDYAGITKDNI